MVMNRARRERRLREGETKKKKCRLQRTMRKIIENGGIWCWVQWFKASGKKATERMEVKVSGRREKAARIGATTEIEAKESRLVLINTATAYYYR